MRKLVAQGCVTGVVVGRDRLLEPAVTGVGQGPADIERGAHRVRRIAVGHELEPGGLGRERLEHRPLDGGALAADPQLHRGEAHGSNRVGLGPPRVDRIHADDVPATGGVCPHGRPQPTAVEGADRDAETPRPQVVEGDRQGRDRQAVVRGAAHARPVGRRIGRIAADEALRQLGDDRDHARPRIRLAPTLHAVGVADPDQDRFAGDVAAGGVQAPSGQDVGRDEDFDLFDRHRAGSPMRVAGGTWARLRYGGPASCPPPARRRGSRREDGRRPPAASRSVRRRFLDDGSLPPGAAGGLPDRVG